MNIINSIAADINAMLDNIHFGTVFSLQQMIDVRTLLNLALDNSSISTIEWRKLLEKSVRLQNEFVFRDVRPGYAIWRLSDMAANDRLSRCE